MALIITIGMLLAVTVILTAISLGNSPERDAMAGTPAECSTPASPTELRRGEVPA